MSALSTLYTLIGQNINDPDHDEVGTGAGSVMLGWINLVLDDTAKLTDCLQVTDTLTGNGSVESFAVTGLSEVTDAYDLWRILSVTDLTNGIVYIPVDRSDYYGYWISLITNSAGGNYVWNLYGYDASRKVYILPIVANLTEITLDFSKKHPTLLDTKESDTPLGILNEYDNLVIHGVSTIYYASAGNMERAQYEFARYSDWMKRLSSEVGTNPEIEPSMSSLYRYIGKTMKELKES